MGRGIGNRTGQSPQQVFIDPRQAFKGKTDTSEAFQRGFLNRIENDWNQGWQQLVLSPDNPFVGMPAEQILNNSFFQRIYDVGKEQLPKEINKDSFIQSNWDSFYQEELAKSIYNLVAGNQPSIFFNKPLIYIFESQAFNENLNSNILSDDLKVITINIYRRYIKSYFNEDYIEDFYTQWAPDMQKIKDESSNQCSFSIINRRLVQLIRKTPYSYKDSYFMSLDQAAGLADKIWAEAKVASADPFKRKASIKSTAYTGENHLTRRLSGTEDFRPESIENFISSESKRIVSNQIVSLCVKETGQIFKSTRLEKIETSLESVSNTGFLKRLDPLFQISSGYYSGALKEVIKNNKTSVDRAASVDLLKITEDASKALYEENNKLNNSDLLANKACQTVLYNIAHL